MQREEVGFPERAVNTRRGGRLVLIEDVGVASGEGAVMLEVEGGYCSRRKPFALGGGGESVLGDGEGKPSERGWLLLEEGRLLLEEDAVYPLGGGKLVFGDGGGWSTTRREAGPRGRLLLKEGAVCA